MSLVRESDDYKIVVQTTVGEGSHLVYSIIHKDYGVVEAEVPFLCQAYDGLKEMQGMLDKQRREEVELSIEEPLIVVPSEA